MTANHVSDSICIFPPIVFASVKGLYTLCANHLHSLKWRVVCKCGAKQRAVIQFLTTANVYPTKTHRQMEGVCGEKCATICAVRLEALRCWQILGASKVWRFHKSRLLAQTLILSGTVKHREEIKKLNFWSAPPQNAVACLSTWRCLTALKPVSGCRDSAAWIFRWFGAVRFFVPFPDSRKSQRTSLHFGEWSHGSEWVVLS